MAVTGEHLCPSMPFSCTSHLRVMKQAVFVLCSLTWTDAHLHRQMITVLSGPVVNSFDREFRILFAASSPVPETWRTVGSPVEVTHQLKDFSNLRFQKRLPLDTDITSPPSPPADYLLDWEAMGVVRRDLDLPSSPRDQHEEVLLRDMLPQNNIMFEKNTPAVEDFAFNGNQFADKKRYLDPFDLTARVQEYTCVYQPICI